MARLTGTYTDYFIVKCHACGHAYAIHRGTAEEQLGRGVGQERFLAMRPRCINVQGNVDTSGKGAYYGVVPAGTMCGSLLGRGMHRGSMDAPVTAPNKLLGWTVARSEHVFTEPPKPEIVEVEKVVEHLITDDEVAALREELERMKVKYETPCPLLVKHWNDDDTFEMVRCGGFLGHNGDCAEVW